MRTATLALALLLSLPAGAQEVRQGPPLNVTVRSYTDVGARTAPARLFFDPDLRPFYHGVASGDPTHDGVVLWTRVTPPTDTEVEVGWRVSTDPALADVVQSGTAMTDRYTDYTVRVEAGGLDAGTTYYYGFTALGANSLTGRTRTAPSVAVDRLRFAVTSCSNYQQGYFDAYRGVAARADLDAVFHLGDYFYEYGAGVYGDDGLVDDDRAHVPLEETVSLEDYRLRHSLYKLDPDLRAAHQQHPWITVWDDHESANDAWEDGAENHNEFLGLDADGDSLFAHEGLWASRKGDAQRAYFEWMPLRRPEPRTETGRIYRRLSYGPLAEVLMLDTRLEGRMEQLSSKTSAVTGEVVVDTTRWLDPDRTLLGPAQREWVLDGLAAAGAQWKLLGNQVMMTQLAFHPSLTGADAPFTNLDAWDGYPAERARLLTTLDELDINDAVVMTGDIHTTWASDLPLNPFVGYDPATGAGSVAVEFVTPSVTAANLNENLGIPPENVPEDVPTPTEIGLAQAYPQLKTVELDEHGYYVLSLTEERAQADWYYVNDIRTPGSGERFSRAFYTLAGENRLQSSEAPSAPDDDAPALAPSTPPVFVTAEDDGPVRPDALLIVGTYPNPARDRAHVAYVLNEARDVRAVLLDAAGREVAVLHDGPQAAGAYALDFETAALAAGLYLVRISDGQTVVSRTVTVAR
jgi:alkaline phosphatase D